VSALEQLATAAGRALDPLARALTDREAMTRLLRVLGWTQPVSSATLDRLADLFGAAAALGALPDLLDDLPGSLPELIEATTEIVDAVGALATLDAATLAELPGPLAHPSTWADLATAIPHHLLARELERSAPALLTIARLTGIATDQGPQIRPRTRFHLDALGAVLTDPAGSVAAVTGWGGAFRAGWLQHELGSALTRFGVPVRVRARRPEIVAAMGGSTGGFETEIALVRGTGPGGYAEVGLIVACAADGGGSVYLGNLAEGDLDQELVIADGWTLELSGEVNGTATIGALLRPDGPTVVGGEAALGASAAIVGHPPAGSPWVLLGDSSGTRVELDGVRIELGIAGTVTEPDIYLLVRVDEGALRVVIQLAGADSFLRGVLGDAAIEIATGGELSWGTVRGFGFSGGLGLEIVLPVGVDLGPLHVESLTLALAASDDGAALRATAVLGLTIGPFAATATGIGATVELVTGGTGLAGLDAALGFVPPSQIGFALDLGPTGGGGGYIAIDAETGRYAGALALDLLAVGLGAIVVVDTQLPGDPDGWALFASISATFPSLPLGFGFFLSGVGGVVCLNRTMDAEAIAAGLRTGAVDAVLFPDDPLHDAPYLISQLDSWFPLAAGSCVFGVAATITWGTPVALVTGQLGVLVSFPDLTIAVLGSVFLALPTPEEALLELHLDSIGIIDPTEGTVLVAASLYDSSLLSTIQLSGDMAMYASVGANPYFLLSIGGYNPAFQPPAGLPSAVLGLQRMRAEVSIGEDVWYALEAYVAITSNTLQFGALASLEASVKFLTTTYTARGEIGFDVLLVFSPFSFAADFHAGVSVTAGRGDKELLAVSLDAHLEGPKPWYATGSARFSFLGIDVPFEIEVGGAAATQAPPRTSVLAAVAAALVDPGAWRGVLPAGADVTVVTLADAPDVEGEVWVRPDCELEAVQTVAPLDRALDRYGRYVIDGPSTLHLDAAGLAGSAAGSDGGSASGAAGGLGDWEPVLDWFAPAQYDQLTRAQELSAPSYEEMTAGVRLTAGGIGVPTEEATTVTPDYEVRVLDELRTERTGVRPLLGTLAAVTANLRLDPAARRPARLVSGPRLAVTEPAWRPMDATTGVATGSAGSYRTALRALDTTAVADPGTVGTQRVVPAYAASGTVR
jgi:hypothetical protein